jgi:hypothetical protein
MPHDPEIPDGPAGPREGRRTARELRTRTRTGTVAAVILLASVSPALAQKAASGAAFSQRISMGVGTYWPWHALFIVTGFLLLLTGFVIARYRKTGKWYRTHMVLEGAGAASILAGLAIGVYMVALSGFPHLRNAHELLGVTAGSLVIVTVIIGYFIRRARKKDAVRTGHRWLGRISIALVVVNIALGLFFLSLVLGR